MAIFVLTITLTIFVCLKWFRRRPVQRTHTTRKSVKTETETSTSVLDNQFYKTFVKTKHIKSISQYTNIAIVKQINKTKWLSMKKNPNEKILDKVSETCIKISKSKV